MATSTNTVTQLNGIYKNVYADKVNDLIPDGVKFYNLVDFVPSEKTSGGSYNQPVILSHEHGSL